VKLPIVQKLFGVKCPPKWTLDPQDNEQLPEGDTPFSNRQKKRALRTARFFLILIGGCDFLRKSQTCQMLAPGETVRRRALRESRWKRADGIVKRD
jgi:hypothetical protein